MEYLLNKKAIFLDRDGVINKEINYLHKINDFIFIDGVFDACRYFQDLGYSIFIITNQSGISRKLYKEEDYHILTKWMVNEFKNNNKIIKTIYNYIFLPLFIELYKVTVPNTERNYSS